MQAKTETSLFVNAVLELSLDTDRILSFLQAFSDKGYSRITLNELVDITVRKVGITSEHISRLRSISDRHQEMNKAEFARYMRVSRQTIYNWIDEGLLILTPDKAQIRTSETACFWELLLHLIGHD